MNTKAEHAAELHQRGCNCAQAVACTFCKEFGISEDDMFRIAEGFGLGMGVMEMCGALSGMAMIIGLDNSQGGTEYRRCRSFDRRISGRAGKIKSG